MDKAITLLLLTMLTTACAQTRDYAPVERDDLSAKINGLTLAVAIDEFNAQMDCDMWAIDPSGAAMNWKTQEQMGAHAGWWNQLSGEISLSEDIADKGDLVVKAHLLHELGHSLGYEHVSEPYQIMSASIQSSFPVRSYQVQIDEFLEQIQNEQPCRDEVTND